MRGSALLLACLCSPRLSAGLLPSSLPSRPASPSLPSSPPLSCRLGGDFRDKRSDDPSDDDPAAFLSRFEGRSPSLTPRPSPTRPPPPIARRSRLSRSDAGTLVIQIPPKGLGADSVVGGAFSLAWFSAVAPATFLSGGAAPMLFMLPFWAAGGLVAKTAVLDPFVSSELTIGRYAWSLRTMAYGGVVLKMQEGSTTELRGAQAEVAAYVNGVPQLELRLYSEAGMSSIGVALTLEEVEYLASEINEHLEMLEDQTGDED